MRFFYEGKKCFYGLENLNIGHNKTPWFEIMNNTLHNLQLSVWTGVIYKKKGCYGHVWTKDMSVKQSSVCVCEQHQSKQPAVCELAKLDMYTSDEHTFTNTFAFWQGFPHTQLLLILYDRICILNKNTHIHTGPNLHTIKDTLKLNRWLDTHTHAETQIPQPSNYANRKQAIMIYWD